jgi:acetyl esterase/lipase
VRRLATVITAIALFATAAQCHSSPTPEPDCSSVGSVAHRDLRYDTDPGVVPELQSLDLYVPERPDSCAATPLVAYVHGGGFVTGDKARQVADKADLFTGEGWAFASLNYRLVDDAGSGATNGEYPAAEDDIAAALAYLVEHAGAYDLDPRRIMLLGHSAGAFLVSLVSTDERFVEAAGIELTDIVCTAPLDTTYDIPARIAGGGTEEQMFRKAFGDDPSVWAAASPPANVAPGKGIPAFHLVTRGSAARVAQTQEFATALRAAGIEADAQVVRPLTHPEVNDAVGDPGDTVVTPALMEFYRRCARDPRPG